MGFAGVLTTPQHHYAGLVGNRTSGRKPALPGRYSFCTWPPRARRDNRNAGRSGPLRKEDAKMTKDQAAALRALADKIYSSAYHAGKKQAQAYQSDIEAGDAKYEFDRLLKEFEEAEAHQ